ncbi:MAG TPA: hypothetical protein VH208_00730 [Myxococcaceae bacterium]|nr:hypothetical protein [Myxococcaceae bacterium]
MSKRTPGGCVTFADSELIAAFEDGRVSKEIFQHPDHIRLAYLYLRRSPDLAEAAASFRAAFRRFTVAQGVPHLYNETITWAYLILIAQRMRERPAPDSFAFLRDNPELATHRTGLLARYYDLEEVSRSAQAKELFLLPTPR